MTKTRSKELDLDLNKIDIIVLEDIIRKIEEAVENYLGERLPPKSEYDIIIKLDKKADKIVFNVDIGVKGGYSDIIDYERLAEDAINIARRLLENELKKYRRSKENIEQHKTVSSVDFNT